MTEHCRECGSRICAHGNCPECRPCQHCSGGDRSDKYFPEEDRGADDRFTAEEREQEIDL